MSAAGTENTPLIAWNNFAADATMSTLFGTDAAGFPASNAATGSTYDEWKGIPTDDRVALRAQLTESKTVTMVAIAAHNAADIGAGVVAQRAGFSRTNEIPRSQDFSTGWFTANVALTSAATTGPDGTMSAGLIVEDTAVGVARYVTNTSAVNFTAGTAYSVSCYVKRATGIRHFALTLPSAAFAGSPAAAFNLDTGVATISTAGTNTSAGITDAGAGWLRCAIKSDATATASSTDAVFRMVSSPTNGKDFYTGDGASGLYIWGAQIESGGATSYIYTTTAPASSSYHDLGQWVVPSTPAPIAWYSTASTLQFCRVLFHNVSPSVNPTVGVFFCGDPMAMDRPFYQGFAPILTPTEVELQSNVSAGGHLLGSSVVKRGSRIAMQFNNLSDTFVRGDDFKGFMAHFNDGGGAFAAWRPTKYADDLHYFWRDGATLQPTNSGPRDLMNVTIEGRVYEG